MKKPLSLLIALMMLAVPVLAMAEADAGVTYATYRNETNGYTIDYPEGWTLLSKETVQAVMRSLADGETQIEGMDSSVLEAYKSQIESVDMAMFMSPDIAVGVNIVYQAMPAKVTSDDMISRYPGLLQQLQSAYQDYKELADPQVETVGGHEFFKISGQYSPPDATFIMLQAYHCTDSTLYVITYTINTSKASDVNALVAISDDMLASFVPA